MEIPINLQKIISYAQYDSAAMKQPCLVRQTSPIDMSYNMEAYYTARPELLENCQHVIRVLPYGDYLFLKYNGEWIHE